MSAVPQLRPGPLILRLAADDDVAGWRDAARRLDRAGVEADSVLWTTGADADLFAGAAADPLALLPEPEAPVRAVPRAFLDLAERALLHSQPERFGLMYRLLRRLRREPGLLEIATDVDVARAQGLAKAVRRDMHKMTAFVRFRAVTAPDGGEAFVAWFEPEHHIIAATAPFFMRRFTGMRWSILSPRRCAHWDGETLSFSDGVDKASAPDGDALEEVWRTYYAAIFNPARLKVKAMKAEMPVKYWRNLPEASLIQPLIREALPRAAAMVAAEPTLPRRRIPPQARMPAPQEGGMEAAPESLAGVAAAAASCTRCHLHQHATQTVPGNGPADAAMMFVGEQPGDQEDLAGRAFIGPAGKVFDAALERVGIDRATVYVTNAVKHFKFEPRGKRRIHKKPDAPEIDICRWWLDAERALLRPKLIVAMGATAARGITGRTITVGKERGRITPLADGTHLLVTVHPSYLLRLPDEASKRTAWNDFLADMRMARDFCA
jgi:DNA polymerase